MSPPPSQHRNPFWNIIDSFVNRSRKRGSRRRRQRRKRIIRRLQTLPEDIEGAGGGRKNYGPLNYESADGWDRSSIDALMSDNVPSQELAQSNVAAPDMTKEYVDRYFGFLPPKLLKNIISHEKSRRRHRIDAYFRTEHGRLPPRISRLLYGSYIPPEYGRKPVASPPPPATPPAYPHFAAAVSSPAPSSIGSSVDELVKTLLSDEQVQQQEIRSAQNTVDELDTILEVLNSGFNNVKEHLSTAASPQDIKPSILPPSDHDDDDYLQSLLDDIPSFNFGEDDAAHSPPNYKPDVTGRYIAMKQLGVPPSSPPPFSDDDEEPSPPQQQPLPMSQRIANKSMQQQPLPMSQRIANKSMQQQPLPMSQRIARKSMSNIVNSTPSAPAAAGVSNVHKLLRTVFRDHATGRRNTKDATHKILDIAHNITKEHIQ